MLFTSIELTSIMFISFLLMAIQRRVMPQISVKKVTLLFINLLILSQLISFKTIFYVAIVSLIVYMSSSILNHDQINTDRKSLLVLLISLLISLLLITKYNWAQKILIHSKFEDLITGVKLIQSIGLSYIFFKLIHFLVDSYRKLLPALDIVTFLNYIFFFPTYLSGPIDRYQNFYKWLNRKSSGKAGILFWASLYRIFIGVVKKFALEPLVIGYALDFNSINITNIYLLDVLLSLIAYSFYIYLNFSGYSDIAIGTGMLIGFRIPENFRNPYFAKNISEFWKRWHITLSSILKEYIFLPFVQYLSRRFSKTPRIAITLSGYFVTFAICGIWHGSTLNFLLWGIWHAIGLAFYYLWKQFIKKGRIVNNVFFKKILVGVSVLVTFSFVSIGWLFFNYSIDEISTLSYSLRTDISANPHYFPGYGWGININYEPPNKRISVDVEYRLSPGNGWMRYFSGRSGEYNFVHIHGSEKHNDSSRNLSSGKYEVRVRYNKNDASSRWVSAEVVIPDYENSRSFIK